MISQEFKNALKLHPVPKYKLAWTIGVSPSVIYHLISCHQYVRYGDERLLKIADLIQFPRDKVFQKDSK